MVYIEINFIFENKNDDNNSEYHKSIYKIKNVDKFYDYLMNEIKTYTVFERDKYYKKKIKGSVLVNPIFLKYFYYLLKKKANLTELNTKIIKKIISKYNGQNKKMSNGYYYFNIKEIKKPFMDLT